MNTNQSVKPTISIKTNLMNSSNKPIGTADPFAAMRRACGPDLLPASIKPRAAANILHLGMRLYDQREVTLGALRGDTISWRLEREGWASVRWCTVTEYAPGFIRLRNDVIASIPKQVWPFVMPRIRNFELTFHCSEITVELGRKVFAFCNQAGAEYFTYGWDLFEGEETYPQYAWTKLARKVYAEKR